VLGRRLHRQVRRLLALEDAIDITSRLPELVDLIGSIGDQPAGGGEETLGIHRREPVSGRKRDYQIAMADRCSARRYDQASVRSAREGGDGALDLAGIAHIERIDFHGERRRHGLDGGKLAGPGAYVGIPRNCRSRHAWCNLLEQFQPFAGHAELEIHKPGDVAAWPRQAVNKAAADHSTSSARASTEAGRSSPSAFAVLRLITSSYFVGACTGRS